MDDIETRLKQFIQMEGISPASFADKLGMQRSGISHLLNGRNKPSYDFIARMLSAYPDLNADWLLLGKGKPYKSSTKESEIQPTAESSMDFDNLFPQPLETAIPDFNGKYAESQMNTSVMEPSEPLENPKFVSQPDDHTFISKPQSAKTISKILIFYSDGTFEER